MRKIYAKTVLVALLFALFTGFSLVASNAQIAEFGKMASNVMISTDHVWKSAPAFVKPVQTKIEPKSTVLKPSEKYDLIEGPDGTQWYATQTNEIVNYSYVGSDINIYNNRGELQNTIAVEVPEDGDCNNILVGNVITNKLFDRDQSTHELTVTLHIIYAPGVTSYVTQVYDIASGKLKFTYEGFMTIVQSYTGYSYEPIAVLSYVAKEEGVSLQKYDVYTKATMNSNGAFLKKSFSVPLALAEYQVGGVFNVFTIGSDFYYVVSQYEKEYLDPASYEDPWEIVPTADNKFVASIYNKNFVEVGKFSIPVTSTSQNLKQYGVGLYGSEDLTKGFWDETNELRLVVTTVDFEINTGNESTSFDVYDMEGNVVKNIATDVSDWMNMYDIYGQSKQMAFLSADAQTLSMVDVPSCETVVTFGATVGGEAISTSIDRYQVGDSYQYVVALAAPESDDNDDIFQRFAWITKEGEIDRIVKFDVGQYNAGWIPLVLGEVMNPYLFDTDSQREYVFILNQRKSDSATAMLDEVRIVKEDGTIVAQYQEDPNGKGDLGTCALLGVNSENPTLLIPFRSSETEQITVELEFLPISMLSAGGEGTKENPYKITSAGDMAMISRNPAAHYQVVNDFDANDYGAWKSIPNFTGTFDGGNYKISNLHLDGNEIYPAIFANTEATKIKNVTLESPKVYLGENATSVGFLISESVGDTITNVHVNKAEVIGGNSNAEVGGIVGRAMFNTEIKECSVNELDINAPKSSAVGGIVGSTLTSSNVMACAVTGTIVANNTIGGVVGAASTGCKVVNCHVDVDIEGDNTIGGIVGAADRGGIHNCYIEGSIVANGSRSSKAGGVAGSLTPDWEATEGTEIEAVISGNVVALKSITANAGAAHRIVGYTRWDDDLMMAQWDPTIIPQKELALANNYVVSTLSVIDNGITAEATSTEGADVVAEDLNKTFFETLGFKYGTDVENPWNKNSANDPCLYFEQANGSSGVDFVEKNKAEISYDGKTIIAADAEKIEIYSISGLKVVETAGIAIDTANIAQGIYIVVVTDENGMRKSVKISVK